MRPLARFVLAVLILALAAGTFVQGAAVDRSKMNMPMAMSQDGDHMPGCQDCGDDPDATFCFMMCTLPALGLPPLSLTLAPMVRMPIEPSSAWGAVGQPRAPDPYPPRPSILN
jgi:hypothetical protein